MVEVALAARANLVLGGVTNVLVLALAAVVLARLLEPATYADYATMMAVIGWLLLITKADGNVGFSRFQSVPGSAFKTMRLFMAWEGSRLRMTRVLLPPRSSYLTSKSRYGEIRESARLRARVLAL